MFVVYSPDYCHNQRLYRNVSSAPTVFILRQYSLLIFHNTGSVDLNSQQVNAVQLPSVGDVENTQEHIVGNQEMQEK